MPRIFSFQIELLKWNDVNEAPCALRCVCVCVSVIFDFSLIFPEISTSFQLFATLWFFVFRLADNFTDID